MLKQVDEGLKEKPGRAVVDKLTRQAEAIRRLSEHGLEQVRLTEMDTRAELVSYEIAAMLPGGYEARSGSTRGSKWADIQLTVQVPDTVEVYVGGQVREPYALLPFDTYDGRAESEDEREGRLAKEASERVKALANPDEWGLEPPQVRPAKVHRKGEYWYLIIAPQSEGLMASFQRLQVIRDYVGGLPAELFGVVTDNAKLCELAETQGYMAFLGKHTAG